MSGSSVLLFVGTTTLVAAVVTLCAFQITAAKMERRINRRSDTLEGPVPGHRSLSSIGINTESARSAPRPSRAPARQSAASMGASTDIPQAIGPSTPPAPSTPSLAGESQLNSLQTIRARSAALHTDIQTDQSAAPRSLTPSGIPPAQRLPRRSVSEPEQDQGPAIPRAKSRLEKGGGVDSISPSSAPAAETAAPTIAPKTPMSKRPKRANAQAPPDAPADLPSLDLLDALQPSEIGQDGGLPDIFAGLNEAEAGIQGLPDDLSDIDGGGLPTPPPKTPQRSRR